MILQWISGDEKLVKALYDSYVHGVPSSVLAQRYGFTTRTITNYRYRIGSICSSTNLVTTLMKIVFPYIEKLKPIIEPVGEGKVMCRICKIVMPESAAKLHISYSHRKLLNELALKVLEESGLLEKLLAKQR